MTCASQTSRFLSDSSLPNDHDSNQLHELLALFCRHPYLDATFTKREKLIRFLQDVLTNPLAKNASAALVYGAIATGSRHYQRSSYDCQQNAGLSSGRYFEYAVSVLESCSGDANALTRFQAALTLLLYALRWRTESMQKLLAQCLQCIQILKLNSRSSIVALSSDKEEELHLATGFWLFYVLEKGHSIRTGQFSSIPDECIDHIPPGLGTSANHTGTSFVQQCLLARLSSHAMQHLQGWEAHYVPCHEQRQETEEIDLLLEAWKEHSLAGCGSDSRPSASQELPVYIDYYELLLYIHADRLSSPTETKARTRSREVLVESSQEILRLIGHMDNLKIADDW